MIKFIKMVLRRLDFIDSIKPVPPGCYAVVITSAKDTNGVITIDMEVQND